MAYFRYSLVLFFVLTLPLFIVSLSEGEADKGTEAVKEETGKKEEAEKKLGDASKVIQKFNDTLLDSMKKGENMTYEERFKFLAPVVKKTFSFSYMAAKSTGKHWKSFNDNQKWLIKQKYAEWTTATYTARFHEYDDEKFEVASENKKRNTVSVTSYIIKSDGEKVEFVYRLRKFGGKWKVIDILLKGGVSQLALTRSQFVSLLDSNGDDGLLAMFEKKIKEFKESHQ